jgi:hypothetical protein
MITILAVGKGAERLAGFGAGHPSVEVVTADGAEDALERLARNRRIDAVLILAGPDAGETARLVREEDPGAPPLYAPAAAGEIPGVRRLPDGSGAELLEALLRATGPD